MIRCPCHGCKERVAEPNCHDPKRCARWAIYAQKNEERKAAKREADMLSAYNNMDIVKTKNYKGWMYIQGDKRGIEYGRRKKRYLSGEIKNLQR